MDDHRLFRSAIKDLIDREPDLMVAAEAGDGETAVKLAEETMADLILMDINMPGMGGLQATREIKRRMPSASIVMLTASDQDQVLWDSIVVGAEGYLVKTVDPSQFLWQIRSHLNGEVRLVGPLAVKLRRLLQERDLEPSLASLTEREREVLAFVGEGASNRQIAHQLNIAENTVKNHLRNILQKLHCANRVQAAAYAIRQGLVKEPQ